VLATVASLVGALVLARAVNDPNIAAEHVATVTYHPFRIRDSNLHCDPSKSALHGFAQCLEAFVPRAAAVTDRRASAKFPISVD
jgi:hypothetical protein